MSLRAVLQDHPTPLVWAWEATARVLCCLRPLFERWGLERSSRLVRVPEEVVKGLLFDCQDCGQCVLHYTGMTCPMTCPKHIRNGPCGGVRRDGHCEVKPEMPCVWVQAIARAPRTPYAREILRLNPPVDWRLVGQASWVTYALGRDRVPTGSDVAPRYASEALPPSGPGPG
jgi:hypothetical protein